jgi:hypothetical protein
MATGGLSQTTIASFMRTGFLAEIRTWGVTYQKKNGNRYFEFINFLSEGLH